VKLPYLIYDVAMTTDEELKSAEILEDVIDVTAKNVSLSGTYGVGKNFVTKEIAEPECG
jgi:DNA replication protein DnaC